ncbi:MAG: WcaF family extracellular polysaccharide biosynthesis acetyltransferase [Polynucleobacter sp.]|nr:WcaF family extracellular polysaccharide biosynthesis acetyltransferase [Polynucleobacter sp.]
MKSNFQDLCAFRLPKGFRGRSAFSVQIWWIVQASVFRWSPQVLYGFRRFVLRMFGAKIGKRVLIRPSAKFTYPWKVVIGDFSWIGDDVIFYSLDTISVGANSVISQKTYLCAGDHDFSDVSFPIRGKPIFIGEQVWVAADCFVAPGVSVGNGVVVGARSSVFSNLPDGMVCYGSPCLPRHSRHSM